MYTHTAIRKSYLLKNIVAYCGYSPTSAFFFLLSVHKHCDNAATNSNSENARSRMVASLQGNVSFPPSQAEVSRACVVRGASGEEWGELIGARVQSAYRLQCRKRPTRDLYEDKGRWVKYWARLGCWIFTMLRPVLAWRAFWNLKNSLFL